MSTGTASLAQFTPEMKFAGVAISIRKDGEIISTDEDRPSSAPCASRDSDMSVKTPETGDGFSFDELYSRRLEFDNAMLWSE
jgi:hypothetical protein